MIFTPLVSPAVTPLDTQFQYSEYPAPGEHFSPLVSPALEAQRHASQHSGSGTVRNSDTSDTTSPLDMNIDFSLPVSASSSTPVRKSRRKITSTSKSSGRTVKQSPSMKPQSRKKQSMSSITLPKEVSGMIEDAEKSKKLGKVPGSGVRLGLPYNQDSSEAGSISPEPLSEILMPPPATPRSSSSSRSPFLNAKKPESQSAPNVPMGGEPATPASLMKIRKEAGENGSEQQQPNNTKEQARGDGEIEQVMEDIVLPEPANAATRPKLTPLDTSNEKLKGTPALSAQNNKSTPSTAPGTATKSHFASPGLSAMASPNGSLPSKRAESKAMGRESKKRTSNGSVQVSPALRPKMSPSIKPLLPEGGEKDHSYESATLCPANG